MVPKPSTVGVVARSKIQRLPPIPKLKVQNPDKIEPNPCLGIMQSVLACWASTGQTATGCVALEQQLRSCMDLTPPVAETKNMINQHLNRFHRHLTGPTKRK